VSVNTVKQRHVDRSAAVCRFCRFCRCSRCRARARSSFARTTAGAAAAAAAATSTRHCGTAQYVGLHSRVSRSLRTSNLSFRLDAATCCVRADLSSVAGVGRARTVVCASHADCRRLLRRHRCARRSVRAGTTESSFLRRALSCAAHARGCVAVGLAADDRSRAASARGDRVRELQPLRAQLLQRV